MRPRNCRVTSCTCAMAAAMMLSWLPFGSAIAQPDAGYITVYADASGSLCSIVDAGPTLFEVFVLHTSMEGMLTSELRVTESAGFTGTFVQESIPFIHVGTFRDGVSIAYGECTTGSLLLGTITYQGQGTSESCSILDTAGNPDSPGGPTEHPLVESCFFELLEAISAVPLIVNPSVDCPPPCAVAVEPTTWGRVKALYRR